MLQNLATINTNNFSTGFFGKLPGFADFINYNMAGNEILTIDKWLQEGLALAKLKYKNEWKNYYNNSLSLNFAYPFTGTENITFGVISLSSDKSGRSFPFIIFSNINKKIFDNFPFYLIPSAYKEIYYSFNNIIESNKWSEDISRLKYLTNEVKLSETNPTLLNNNYQKFISETELCNILDLDNENPIHLNNLLENKLKVYEHFMGINFPANSNVQNDEFIICFYLQLLQKVCKNSDLTFGIFWNQNEDKSGFLFLFFIKPTPKDFIDLLFNCRTSTIITYENKQDNKKDFHTVNSIFRDNLVVNSNISLNKFLNLISNFLH